MVTEMTQIWLLILINIFLKSFDRWPWPYEKGKRENNGITQNFQGVVGIRSNPMAKCNSAMWILPKFEGKAFFAGEIKESVFTVVEISTPHKRHLPSFHLYEWSLEIYSIFSSELNHSLIIAFIMSAFLV